MEKQAAGLTPDEKQETMFQSWISPQGVKFVSPETEKAYRERAIRIKKAVQLKEKPDRVPVITVLNFFPAYYSGLTPYDVMYDYDKLTSAIRKFVLDFQPDANPGAFFAGSGRIFDLLDVKLYAWPGHGVSRERSYQCIEGEYMMADEYDALIEDPSFFWSGTYLPRICGTLEPFRMLQNSTVVQECSFGSFLLPFGLPQVQNTYKILFQAGEETMKWMGVVSGFSAEMAAAGFPGFVGGISKAPFDVIGDTLRGTKGIMMDIFKQPAKLLKALDVITPIMIKMGVSMARMNQNPLVFMPLHKGADGFLSDKHFKEFYWPSLKKVFLGLIEEGCVPFPFVEGSYNSRLEIIRDVPEGKIIWLFDDTDMARAKQIVGDVSCIAGNISSSLLITGSPGEVKEKCRGLIEACASGGGYILANGSAIDAVKPENLKMMINAAGEYGVY